MERIMSQEERIRRAEEIYQRRKSQGVRLTGDSVNLGGKPEFSLFKRLILKIMNFKYLDRPYFFVSLFILYFIL